MSIEMFRNRSKWLRRTKVLTKVLSTVVIILLNIITPAPYCLIWIIPGALLGAVLAQVDSSIDDCLFDMQVSAAMGGYESDLTNSILKESMLFGDWSYYVGP
jgi:hypothetical protein